MSGPSGPSRPINLLDLPSEILLRITQAYANDPCTSVTRPYGEVIPDDDDTPPSLLALSGVCTVFRALVSREDVWEVHPGGREAVVVGCIPRHSLSTYARCVPSLDLADVKRATVWRAGLSLQHWPNLTHLQVRHTHALATLSAAFLVPRLVAFAGLGRSHGRASAVQFSSHAAAGR